MSQIAVRVNKLPLSASSPYCSIIPRKMVKRTYLLCSIHFPMSILPLQWRERGPKRTKFNTHPTGLNYVTVWPICDAYINVKLHDEWTSLEPRRRTATPRTRNTVHLSSLCHSQVLTIHWLRYVVIFTVDFLGFYYNLTLRWFVVRENVTLPFTIGIIVASNVF